MNTHKNSTTWCCSNVISPLRLLNTLLRLCLTCLAAGLVIAALYVSLGRELAPLVSSYREALEQRASEILNAPLRIGRLTARMNGFLPELVAHDVRLGDPSDLSIDQLRLRPDLLGSLLHWQPRLDGLELGGVQLLLRQQYDGRWAIAGLPRGDAAGAEDVAHWLRQLRRFPQVSVVDSRLVVEPLEGEPLTLSNVNLNLDLTAGSDRHQLDGRMLLPDGKPLSLHLDLRLQPSRWRDASADLYLRLPQSDWARWLTGRLLGDWHVQRLLGGGEVWAKWSERTLQRAVVRLHVPQVQLAYRDRSPIRLDELNVTSYFQASPYGDRLYVDSLAMTLDGMRWDDMRLNLQEQRKEGRWEFSSDRLNLATLPLVEQLAPLPDLARNWLQGLRPEGWLKNVHVAYQPEAELAERLRYSMNLEGVGISAYHGVPAAAGVNGRLDGGLGSGELLLDSQGFMLHLAQLFPEPWHYNRARGRLGWRWDDEAFSLWAPYLTLNGSVGRVAGDFMLRLNHEPEREDYLDVRVGLRDGNSLLAGQYLPTVNGVISPALDGWLQRAIHGGEIPQGFFQYQGGLNAGLPPEARNVALYFQIRNAELDYQPGWPALRQANAELFVDNSDVYVSVSAGRLLNSDLREGSIAISRIDPGQPSRLHVDARLLSNVPDGLRILQDSPLPTSEAFAGWEGEGDVPAWLRLDIPLAADHSPQVDVQFSLDGAQLRMPYRQGIELEGLQGDFRFESAKGLSARDLQARFLEQSLQGRIDSKTVNNRQETQLDVRGQMPVASLAQWLGVTQPIPVKGRLPYRLRLSLGGKDTLLRVDSNLQGVSIDMPAPFGKSAAVARYADWRMTLGGEQQRYWLQYGDDLSLALATPDHDWQRLRGELRLGPGVAPSPRAQGIWVRGSLDQVDVPSWQAFLERYARAVPSTGPSLLREAQLSIGHLTGVGLDPRNIDVTLLRASHAWTLGVISHAITGEIRLPESKGEAIVAQLKHLRLPASLPPAGDGKSNTLGTIHPKDLPPLQLRIDRVLLNDDLLGGWSVRARPMESGWRLNELTLNLKGLKVEGDGVWTRVGGRDASSFRGRLTGTNLGTVLEAWGFAPSATSERFSLQVDGSWPGMPTAIRLANFTGTLDADMRNGQFKELQTGGTSALKVLGLLNFNAIGRRLRLDFSDLFGRGLSYDRVRSRLLARDGIYTTLTPTTLTGPSTNLELSGQLDMVREQIDARLLVTLPLTNNLTLAALVAGAPVIGGALFLVDRLLGNQVSRFAAVEYSVRGPLDAPRIVAGRPKE